MLTNIIAYLHTTLAYQSAAMQLMVGQANFDAQQLHLQEPLPITVPANTNEWHLAMPPDGVTGTLTTPNYFYRFNAGKLVSIQRKPSARGSLANSENQVSLIDTNGAYQLARQWLAAISVDVPALESKYPPTVLQVTTSRAGTRGRIAARNRDRAAATNAVVSAPRPVPSLFRVIWGGKRAAGAQSGAAEAATVEILGSTKQCLALRINPNLLAAPPLQVTNAALLLGTPPPPQHFVEDFLGGRSAYETVAHPDKAVAWLLGSSPDGSDTKVNRTPATAVNPATLTLLSQTLTDFNSFSWLDEKACDSDYTVRLQFVKGADTVEILWSGDCDHLQVTHGAQTAEKDCAALVSAALPLLKPGGTLFASANAATLQPGDFLESIAGAISAAGRSVEARQYAPQPPDFPMHRAEPGYLKTVWMRVR